MFEKIKNRVIKYNTTNTCLNTNSVLVNNSTLIPKKIKNIIQTPFVQVITNPMNSKTVSRQKGLPWTENKCVASDSLDNSILSTVTTLRILVSPKIWFNSDNKNELVGYGKYGFRLRSISKKN